MENMESKNFCRSYKKDLDKNHSFLLFVKKKQYFYHDLVIYVSENLTQIPSNKYKNLPILQKKF